MSNISERVKPVGEVPLYLKVLVYGRSGTGKTTFLGTAPKPLLVIDARDHGTASIRAREDTYVLPVESWDDFEQAYFYVEQSKKYASVAIDTVTQLQDMAMSKIVPDGGAMNMRAWGDVAGLMKYWLVRFRDLPKHILFTAQDRESNEPDAMEENVIAPSVGPAVMPSVAKTLNAAVDVIGHTFIREREKMVKDASGAEVAKTQAEYCLRLGAHARYVTKLRYDVAGSEVTVPKILINPSFDRIQDLCKGGNR